MSDDQVEAAIAEYGERVRARQRPVTISEVRSRAGSTRKAGRRIAIVGLVAVVTAAIAIAVTLFDRPDDGPAINAGGPKLPSGQTPDYVATGAGSVFVITGTRSTNGFPGDAGSLVRVDPASGSVVAVLALSGAPAQVAVDDAYAWVSLFSASAVAKIDLDTNRLVATIPLELPTPVCANDCAGGTDFLPVNIDAAGGNIWVSTARGYVAHIDAATNEVNMIGPLEPDQTGSVAALDDGALVAQGNQPLVRIALDGQHREIPNPVDENHGFSSDGVIAELFSSPDHPELGVWATASVDLEPSGGIGIDPDRGIAITAHIEPGARVVGVNDSVWLHNGDRLYRATVFDENPDPSSAPSFEVPEDATIAIDNTTAWWTTPLGTELIGTPLDGSDPVRITIIEHPAPPTPTTTVPLSNPWEGWPTLGQLVETGTINQDEVAPDQTALDLALADGTRFALQYTDRVAPDVPNAYLSLHATVVCDGDCGSAQVTILPRPDPSSYETLATYSGPDGAVDLVRDGATGYTYLLYITPHWVVRVFTFDIAQERLADWAQMVTPVEAPDGWVALELEGVDFYPNYADLLVSLWPDASIEITADVCKPGTDQPPVNIPRDDGSPDFTATRCFENLGLRVLIGGASEERVNALYSGISLASHDVATG